MVEINIIYFINIYIMREYFKFVGMDKIMINQLNTRISNIITAILEVDNENDESFIYNIIKKRIKKVLHNKFHALRARQVLTNLDYYYYTKTKSDKLADKIVKKTDKYLNHLELGEILVSSNLSAIILVHKNAIIITCTHLFFDGINLVKLFGNCLDSPVFNSEIIPKFNYYPTITELKLIPGIIGYLRSFSKKKLTYDSDWKTGLKENLIPLQIKRYNYNLYNIKKIKEYLNMHYKFGFTNTIAIIFALYTFENITKNTFNIGLLTGFLNEERFNNFSCLIVNLKRKENWNKISLFEKIDHISKQFDYANKSYAKSSIGYNYLITNIYNISINANNFIDVLISVAPTTEPVLFNKKPASIKYIDMYGTSMALYVGCYTINEDVIFTVYSRSNDINLDKKDTLQIDEILKAIQSKTIISIN